MELRWRRNKAGTGPVIPASGITRPWRPVVPPLDLFGRPLTERLKTTSSRAGTPPRIWRTSCARFFCTSWLEIMGTYLKVPSSRRIPPLLLSLSSIVYDHKLRRYFSLATEILPILGIWKRSPRSTILQKGFSFPHHFLRGSCLLQKRSPLQEICQLMTFS
jgi:hypothetical protein